MSNPLLDAIADIMSRPAGTVMNVDIIHEPRCLTNYGGDPLSCDCEPSYKEQKTN